MRSTTRRAAASAALVLTSALLLTACNSGGGSTTGGSTASTSAPSGGSGGGSTSGGSGGGSTSGGSGSSTQGTTSGSTSGTGGATAAAAGCRNLVATDAVKAAVTQAYEAESHRGHITPLPHRFLYGECGGTTYAATAFELTPGATYNDQVAAQDDGSTRKYFSLTAGGSWTVLGSAGFPDMGGCIAQVPKALATVWGGCPGAQ
ncbi:hypothetical protein [Streptacidiphilus jiangxiensis]|uniref:Uncharacterized protein n=1 Tax=Streptacidiphilus jiangxiensis TaxID=235985 RepID=A0A1H7J5G0_STRJI|nr:hypothetical protein [Streptacidiphilus jiangxiensis]SEK69908.1 hypothetical protein SAMN05414137_103154 [Streptacidiphilus jiangxiensis]